jgi:hypothetical protein
VIHFRYFDTNYDHNGLWEDLIDEFPDLFASAAAVEDLPVFLTALETGAIQETLVLVFHFNEPYSGGYYRLSAEQIARWRTPTQVLYVTGGEVERVQHYMEQSALPPCVEAYPYSLTYIPQWTPALLQQWRERFETLAKPTPKRNSLHQTASTADSTPSPQSMSESPLHPIKSR